MSLDSFEGRPKIDFEIPPIISDINVVESLKGSTDMVQKITTFMSSANFGVGLILGGSMQ